MLVESQTCFKPSTGRLNGHLHKYVIFLHDMVEAILSSIDLVESMIVNICHHHLDRNVQHVTQ